jgi:hypothetical protein
MPSWLGSLRDDHFFGCRICLRTVVSMHFISSPGSFIPLVTVALHIHTSSSEKHSGSFQDLRIQISAPSFDLGGFVSRAGVCTCTCCWLLIDCFNLISSSWKVLYLILWHAKYCGMLNNRLPSQRLLETIVGFQTKVLWVIVRPRGEFQKQGVAGKGLVTAFLNVFHHVGFIFTKIKCNVLCRFR